MEIQDQIIEKIIEYSKIIIHRHVRPDPDALGSQGGLAEIIKETYPEKTVYVVGEDDPSLLFMNKMDQLDDAEFEQALIIICDTANQERISDQRHEKGDFIIKIDHHPNEDPYGDLLWVNTDASSVSEMIYSFYLYGKEKYGLTLTDNGARLLFAGIVGDTGRFLHSNTSEQAFKFASELRGYNFELTELYTEMYKVKVEVARLNGYVLSNFTFSEEEGVGYIFLTKEVLEKYNATPSEASLLVNTMANVDGLKAWVFFVEEKDQIRVRFRSKGPIVNQLAAKYNGGGHPLAAGATIYTEDEMKDVVENLRKLCKEYVK